MVANIITASRIVFSLVMLCTRPFSTAFYTLYITAGITDMVDGSIARKMGTVSSFGAKLDTVSDFVFMLASAIKVFSIRFPLWLYIWAGIICCIKVVGIVLSLVKRKELPSVHCTENKIAGFVLFLMPLCVKIVDTWILGLLVCFVCSNAAIKELLYILKGETHE